MNELATSFIWTTQTGEQIAVCDMETSHLFNTVRMIFNHSVPHAFRIEGGRYDLRVPAQVRAEALRSMLIELSSRNDLTYYHKRRLQHMASVVRDLATNKLQ